MQVNEIYRDLANIVEQQQEAVEQIGTNTEGAHARAQEGLVQVCVSARTNGFFCSVVELLVVVWRTFCYDTCFSFYQNIAIATLSSSRCIWYS